MHPSSIDGVRLKVKDVKFLSASDICTLPLTIVTPFLIGLVIRLIG